MRGVLLVICAAMSACIGERGPFTNRMANAGTAYLARAARQPVRWQPWGREAFSLAGKLDRPVLLYVGSDDCRWCAETDRAIYADPEIGNLINTLFVPVRVDRDERPDVAQRYQSAVEHLAGLRGWPLTVFLTSEGSAFFGGTYFPADDPLTGRGLKQLLPEVARSYREQRAFVVQQAALLRRLVLASNRSSRGALRAALVEQGTAAVRRDLEDAVRTQSDARSVVHANAAAFLLPDSSARPVALDALDVMIDTASGIMGREDDPPRLVQAALVAGLTGAWVVTSDSLYRNAGRALAQRVAAELPDLNSLGREAVFADQEAFVVEKLLLAAATLGESTVAKRARATLDDLVQRTYARGWGVRHAITPGPITAASPSRGLLQDQVEVALACVAAYQVSAEPRFLDVALDLASVIETGYADSLGGYYDVADPSPSSLPALGDRTMHVFDDVLPGANAAVALLFARLWQMTGDVSYRSRAQHTLEAFAGALPGAGMRAATFLAAARETLQIP